MTEGAYVLGARASILAQLDRSAIVPHVAESQGLKFPLEAIFRSVSKLLMDSSSSEYLFSSEFFSGKGDVRVGGWEGSGGVRRGRNARPCTHSRRGDGIACVALICACCRSPS